MASGTANTMREGVTCPICLELMAEPVFIDCGHIYCRSCILENLEKQQQQSPSQERLECPVCRAQFRRESIRPSMQLESIIDTIKKMEQEHLCEKHGEKLSLFCEDDVQLICWYCERTPQHKGHTTVLVADACQGYKETYQNALAYLREQEEQNKKWQMNIREQIEDFQNDIQYKEERIKSSFKVFHIILHLEEKSYLWRLENEKEQVLKRLQDSEAQLEKQSHELNKLILELERKCQGSAQELLQIEVTQQDLPSQCKLAATPLLSQFPGLYGKSLIGTFIGNNVYCDLFRRNEITECKKCLDVRDTLDRISAMKLNAPEDVSLEIPDMLHVDSIFCELTKLFETDYGNVTLDPDTAHNDLILNYNISVVNNGLPQVKPDTPARFKDLPCVLGCEAFTSGKHFLGLFEICGSLWDVGVCLENVPRDNDVTRDPETGFWAIRHCDDDNYVALTSPLTLLNVQQPICRIGVFLDYEAGLVSFYDSQTGSHIFTFSNASFAEPIRPYFSISEDSYLIICNRPIYL